MNLGDTHHKVKCRVDNNEFLHVVIHEPIPGMGGQPEVMQVFTKVGEFYEL